METRELYNFVERISELLRIDLRQAGADHGLQPVQMEVLHYLSICNRFSDTPMAVTDYLGQTKGTVSQTLKVLENKGFISKHADVADKRLAHLRLTKNGAKLVDASIPPPMFAQTCATLGHGVQKQAVAVLNRLLLALLETNNMNTFGVCRTCKHNRKSEQGAFFCELVQQPLSLDDIQLICKEHTRTNDSCED